MAMDLEDFEDLYPDAEVRGEARARRAKRPLPTVDAPAVYSLGWGVELRYADSPGEVLWVTPSGTSEHPFWWARRQSAERLGARYERLGASVTIHHATRRRTCTSAAKNPWEAGYRASVDGPECGASIETQEVPSLLAMALARRAEKLAEKERAYAARRDAADRKKQAAARKKSYRFAPGTAGDVAAVRYLLRHGLGDDESYGARAHLLQHLPTGSDLMDGDALDTDALKEYGCQLAADMAHSEPAKARALARDLGAGRCVTAEQVLQKTAAVRAGLRERAAKRDATAKANARAGDRAAAKAAKAEKAQAARLAKAARAAPRTIAENQDRADAERAAELQRREAKAAKAREARAAKDRRENARAEAREAKARERERQKMIAADKRAAAKAARAAKRQAEANDIERTQRGREREAQREADAAAARAAGLARGRATQATARREEFAEKQPRLAPRAPRQRVF
jgi:hypothetical protein